MAVMRVHEVVESQPAAPKTPEQQRVAALQLKAERARQKRTRLQQQQQRIQKQLSSAASINS
jgi:urease accessory protein UreE